MELYNKGQKITIESGVSKFQKTYESFASCLPADINTPTGEGEDFVYTDATNIPVYAMYRLFNAKTIKFFSGVKYHVFSKLRVVAGDGYSFIPQFYVYSGTPTYNERRYTTNEVITAYLGSIVGFDSSIRFGPVEIKGASLLTNEGKTITKEYTVRIEFYGAYIIPDDELQGVADLNTFATLLDYGKTSTSLLSNSVYSTHSGYAENANHSNESDHTLLSDRTDALNTMLVGKKIGFYGDSLVTYINDGIKKIGKYLNANAIMVGQGGGRIGNNESNIKQGFATLERCALLPYDMDILVIYGGANDVVEEKVDGILTVTDNLLGSMNDEPLPIADMMNYRVTDRNVSQTSTPGRITTFYQAYKTWLRNLQALFPNTHIIAVTQHRYYYYLKPNGTYDMTKLILHRGAEEKVKIIREVCEEYSVPVCDLWSKSGVNDHNIRTTLIDSGGVAVHPKSKLGMRECNLILNTILENVDRFEVGTYTPSEGDADIAEMKQWIVDLRKDNPKQLSITEAATKFVQYCTDNSIELKNNMYVVFYKDNYGSSVGYHLINKDNPTADASWEQWVLQTFVDPNEPTA